jgi:hypothetical protein
MRVMTRSFLVLACCSCLLASGWLHSKDDGSRRDSGEEDELVLYPEALEEMPEIASPSMMDDNVEVLLARVKDGRYALVPVTVEHGKPLLYSRRIKSLYGKDNQLHVDSGDFPTLARTGLHSETELLGKDMITGVPVSVIDYIGRPGRFSGAGFMAEDEDILTVLTCDNRLVERMGLTHPRMARPLFHVWNLILKEIELGRLGRKLHNIQCVYYNGRKVHLSAEGTKGWQASIFQDEIQGRFDISVRTEMTGAEKEFLRERYSHLSDNQQAGLEEKLSRIHFSEMAPYYIMRYGFYEGHTDYRSDPIAIAFAFGLKSLEEIEEAFPGKLHEVMTNHFKTIPSRRGAGRHDSRPCTHISF